jgi:hypothetical protein
MATPSTPTLELYGRTANTSKSIITVIEQLATLDPVQKDIFIVRYMPLLRSYKRRALLFAIIFHISRSVVTVGSIAVPALLSLSGIESWLTWSISLAVSICNGILTLFKIDKKYYSLHTTWHVMESEGWQFISLAGKYSRPAGANHKGQFHTFCLAIEKIKMIQVEEEYWKTQEAKEKGHATAGQPLLPTATAPNTQSEEMRKFMAAALEQSKSSTNLLTVDTQLNSIIPPA